MNWKLIGVAIAIFVILCTILFYRDHPLSSTVTIRETKFIVELAVTPDEKTKGLSYRKSLLPQHGMLFPYDHKERYDFWMKGMQFPLDFIWIADTTVVDIAKNVQPPAAANLHVVQPKVPVDKILEINAGEIDKFGITIGDTVMFNK
jgi:uncharacterized membrane protein (UPF0127 family)